MIENELLSVDNGTDKIVPADATLVAREYYTSYSKYVLEYRALPSVYDGLKPVQRRIIYTANQFPKKLMKTAKLSGATIQLHPHSSDSIDGAINEMACPLNVFPMFNIKGNFGSAIAGAASTRYTECYLSEAARFNFCQFVNYADYEIGEIGEEEPSALPCLIPYSMVKGSEGIAIGLSTKVMPLNLLDLIDYYIDYIKNDGKSSRLVLPDVGYVLLEMDDSSIKAAVDSYKGRIEVSSIVSQISSTSVLLETIYDRSVDSVINKIDKWYKWFKNDQVGFRDASTSVAKYVFEIYDTSAVTISELKQALVDATRRAGTYTRVLEEDGNAVYASFNYTIKKSLECLNKAIDNKIKYELVDSQRKLDLYNTLNKCKSLNVFNNITSLTQEQLVDLILRSVSSCTEEIAWEITKKPISYLTRSHDKEAKDLETNIENLRNHNRKEYLINLYKELRRMILPSYEEKKHSITPKMVISNPCVKYDKDTGIVDITDGDGDSFKNTIYFVSDSGIIYTRSVGTTTKSSFSVDTSEGDNISGFVTDKFNYIKVVTEFLDNPEWVGISILKIDELLTYDKRYISLRDENSEKISKVEGIDTIPDNLKDCVKGSRVSKTTWKRKKDI